MGNINIRRIMKEKKIGNKALSELSGIPLGTLNKIIYGDTSNPTLDSMQAIAKALGCTLDDLVAEDYDTGYYLDSEAAQMAQEMYDRPELRTLFSATRNVSKEDLEVVQQIVDRIAKAKNGPDDDPA